MGAWNVTGASSRYRRRDAEAPASGDLPWERAESPGGADTGVHALSVTQAVDLAAGSLEKLPRLTVIGEVSGFRGPNARSGHCYFQVKDKDSALECAIWKFNYVKRTFDLRDGLKLQLEGKFSVYKPTGKMSFVVDSFTAVGEGMLRQQVDELARKLAREGLTDPRRKRHIPEFCSRVAVVTSLSGAVIDDVKRTLRRRNPLVELVCVGSKVQGEGASEELIAALGRAARLAPAPDCILLVRGGGSYEDLMTFNDEALARAVAACPIPVVTGIGHEPDNSICDMVSDRRSSTPTAAAESVAPAMTDLIELLNTRQRRLAASTASKVRTATRELEGLERRATGAVSARLGTLAVSLEALASRPCMTGPRAIIERRRDELAQTEDRLAATTSSLGGYRHALELASGRLESSHRSRMGAYGADLARAAASLEALSPLKVLSRGYAIAYAGGAVATAASSFAAGEPMALRLADGTVRGTVTSIDLTETQTSTH